MDSVRCPTKIETSADKPGDCSQCDVCDQSSEVIQDLSGTGRGRAAGYSRKTPTHGSTVGATDQTSDKDQCR